MRYTKPLIASALVLALMFAASTYAAAQLGDKAIPVHWGLSGQPDSFGPAFPTVFLMPGIALAVCLGMAVTPSLMPRAGRLERSWPAYETLWLTLLVFFLFLHGAMLGVGLGYNLPFVRIIVVMVGVLLAVIGNLLGKVRYNYVFGIRTPWTLASERVWDRTHRFAGWSMALGGLVSIAVGLLAPSGAERSMMLVVLPCGVGPALAAAVFSYLESRRQEQGLEAKIE